MDPCPREIFISDFCKLTYLVDIIERGVLGVLIPMNGVFDNEIRLGDGVLNVRNF